MVHVQRQVPNLKEVFELLQFKKFEPNAKKRRLDNALTIWDLRKIAKRRTPAAPFDYVDGAAESEISIRRARQAFRDVEFHPNILKDVEKLDTTTKIFGGTSTLPFGIAPTGFSRLMQTEGERGGGAAAAKAGIPFTLSTFGTVSIEDFAKADNGRKWFQLYVTKKREYAYELVERAAKAGFDTLFFTVDTPIAGMRLRDKRNGFSIPPQVSPKVILNAIPRPWWWIDFLTTEKLEFASFDPVNGLTVAEIFDQAADPTIDYDDLKTIRDMWPGKLCVKGVQTLEEAKNLANFGVDGVYLSNHGGRQLDRAQVPFHLLPAVKREVGNDVEIVVDTGITSGADIVAAMAMGANFTMVGRAWLYGLMAGGEAGVTRMIDILQSEIERTMRLLGVHSIEELGPQHVTQLHRLVPRALPGKK